MQTSLQHAGLSLSNAIAAMVQSALLLVFLRRKVGAMQASRMLLPLAKYIVCATAMWALLYFGAQLVDWQRDAFWLRALGLGLLVTAGGGSYIALAWLLKVREVHLVLDTIKRKLRRRRA